MKIIDSKFIILSAIGGLLTSCATEKAQYGKDATSYPTYQRINNQNIAHSFFLIGDAGNAEQENAQLILGQLKNRIAQADENSTLLFMGDNIYPSGMPAKEHPERALAEEKINDQLELVKDFRGDYAFIPGNHDWYSDGIVGLKEQQDYLIKKTGNKKAFAPKNSCPIETRKIGKDIALIIVDSEWFLADWNKNPDINKNCDIKTQEAFFDELEDQLNKNQNKTVVLAIHHPLIDNGSHGGNYSMKKQLFPFEKDIPLPGLAPLINISRTAGGVSHQDLSHPNYRKLSARIRTLITDKENVIVVSGHDHNLQYLEKNNIKQVISGAGSKSEPAAAINTWDFSYGGNGYAVLEITKNGDAQISYYGRKNNEETLLYTKKVLEHKESKKPNYPEVHKATTSATIYTEEQTKKSNFYKWLWGNNYRDVYSTPIDAKNLKIDTLYGGAKPTRAGGGHQTSSLRLDTPKGEYVIRGLKKSGVRFMQAVAFKDRYVIDDFKEQFADNFLLDFYTSSHPYTPLAIGKLSSVLGIKSTEPKLYYIPKQNALKDFNTTFGNELYYLEVRPGEAEESSDPVIGTNEVLTLLAKDEKYRIDEKAFIKARLFDMLIGDWDRHYDQWKWEERKEGDFVYLSPFPKDRDQAFVKYDGWLTKLILDFPDLRHMQSFGPKIKDIKWFNMEPYPLDLAFTRQSNLDVWKEQAKFITDHLTPEIINEAFLNLPKEVQGRDIEKIKENLEIRKKDLESYATAYYDVLQKYVILTGTNKKDKFLVQRLPNNQTSVTISRLKKSGEEEVFTKVYSNDKTKEIWLYGLDDDDVFSVAGDEKSSIKIRIIGGHDDDTYAIQNGKKVRIYDYASNSGKDTGDATAKFTNDYNLNHYDYKHLKYNFTTFNPNGNYNPDDDITIGGIVTYTKNGFRKNPFAARHTLKANYFTGSQGYQFAYTGVFPRLTGHWFLQVDANYSSAHFIKNYFGMGNLTENLRNVYDADYYRVRAKELSVAPSLHWKKNATHFFIKPIYEAFKIDPTEGRRILNPGVIDAKLFDTQHFGGVDINFTYENSNKKVNPSLGMRLNVQFNYRQNLHDNDKKLPSLETGLGYIHYLTTNEKLILSTYASAKWLFSNDYEFYQMATLGGNQSLRGFRFDRFYGKNSFYQTSDLRLDLGTFKNYYVPLNIGLFGGFDYGRVWMPGETNNQWHTSYGAGLWINALDLVGIQTSYFRSSDGGRIVFGFGLNF